MTLRGILLAVLLVQPTLMQPALAQPVEVPREAIGQQDAEGTALVAAFSQFCLEGFPGDAQPRPPLDTTLVPLAPAVLNELLHGDPGRGWAYTTPDGLFVLTLENPPYHTCAVRRVYQKQPLYSLPWLVQIGAWARRHGRGAFEPIRYQVIKRDNLVIEARGQVLHGGAEDVFLELKTTYPDGRVEERLARRTIDR